jgi:hypothetical protein
MEEELMRTPEKRAIHAKKITRRVIHKCHIPFWDFDRRKNDNKPLLFFPKA